jgi:hypothetical protein
MNLNPKNAVGEWIQMPKELVYMKGTERGGFKGVEFCFELAYRIYSPIALPCIATVSTNPKRKKEKIDKVSSHNKKCKWQQIY